MKDFISLRLHLVMHIAELFAIINNSLRHWYLLRFRRKELTNPLIPDWFRTKLISHEFLKLCPRGSTIPRLNNLPPVSGISVKKILGDRHFTIIWTINYLEYLSQLENLAFSSQRSAAPEKRGGFIWTTSRSHWYAHNPQLKCNMLLNNISETFNSYIKDARDKPIITMLEMIRRQLMKRFHAKRDGMLSCKFSICPKIHEKLEASKKDAMNCIVYVGGNRTFEVSHCTDGNKVVNLIERTCTCMKWQMTGIPCSHSVAAIFDERGKPQDYVDQIFSKGTFLKTYYWHIHPVPDKEDWPECNYDDILPPNVKIAPGRPKKKRIREEGEPSNTYKISRKGTKIKCGNCKNEGHNAKTCKMPSNPNRKIYKRVEKAGQPRRKEKKDN
ncbi:hypothetical protein OROGR_010573 [Orobanche gracilis]